MLVAKGYKQTEAGIIPEDWELFQVKDVVSYTNGVAHEGVISERGEYVVVNSKFISTEGRVRKHSKKCFLPASIGDVLMVMSDVPKGKAIAKTYYVEKDHHYTVNQRICILRGKEIDKRLLFYKLNRNAYYLSFDDGAKQTNLRKGDVLSCLIPLPPTKAEQEAIAEALSDADSLIESLQQLIAKKRQIKQGAMQTLLHPKPDWVEKSVAQLSEVSRGRVISHKEIAKATTPKYPVYSSQTSNSGIMGYLDSYDFAGEYVTWTTDGAHAGTVFYRNGKFNCTNVCGTLRVHDDHAPFICIALGNVAKKHVSRHLGNPKLMNDVMKKISFKCPPTVEEQTRIATILSDMDEEITTLETKLTKAQQIKQGMMSELLTGKTRLV